MIDPIKGTPELIFWVFAGTVTTLVAWLPSGPLRLTLRRIYGRKAVASVSEQRLRSTQTTAMLVSLGIAAMLIIHSSFRSLRSELVSVRRHSGCDRRSGSNVAAHRTTRGSG